MENKGKVLMQRFEFGRLLGQGSFAKVYYGRNIETGQSVAIKVIDKEKVFKVGLVEQTKREISVMKLVKHPNVLQLYEVLASKTKIYYIMEYAKGGELFNKVSRGGRLKEANARKYFQQLISAVDFCHRRGVYHRDLKPENLLLGEDGVLKVSDFGLSALSESTRPDGLLHTTCGTPAYVAPEVICRRGYNGAKSDIWSCGVILFVLLAGYLPFHDNNLMEMYRKISRAEYKLPNWISPDARRLLSKMLDPNPKTRISAKVVMAHPWFRKGLDSDRSKTKAESGEPNTVSSDNNPCQASRTSDLCPEAAVESSKLTHLNAFDIISLSAGFDLSGLFPENDMKDEVQFTSMQPASTIISKLEDVAKQLQLKITKKDGGLLRLERQGDRRKEPLSIDVEIFEFTSQFHLVELKKSCGDVVEFQKSLKKDIRPALGDIIWAWQGDQQHQQEEIQQ